MGSSTIALTAALTMMAPAMGVFAAGETAAIYPTSASVYDDENLTDLMEYHVYDPTIAPVKDQILSDNAQVEFCMTQNFNNWNTGALDMQHAESYVWTTDAQGRASGYSFYALDDDLNLQLAKTVAYQYDDSGSLILENQVYYDTEGAQMCTDTIVNTYDAAGNITSTVDQSQWTDSDPTMISTVYNYNELGQIASKMTEDQLGGQYLYTYTYDENGRLVSTLSQSFYEGVEDESYRRQTEYRYDSLGYLRESIEYMMQFDDLHPDMYFAPMYWTVYDYGENNALLGSF